MMPQGHHAHHAADADAFVDQAVMRLRARGGRVTRERRRMLEVLAAEHTHLSADAIAVRLMDDGIHRTTVFRALEAFAAAGVVTHRQVPGGATEYHLATQTHLHAHCVSCGAVVALPVHVFDEATAHVRALTGFAFDPDRSALGGICAECTAVVEG